MKKIIATLLAFVLLLVPMSLTASAVAINADEQRILDCLYQKATFNNATFIIPVNYVKQAENYFKTIDATKEQADKAISYIEAAAKIVKESDIKTTADLKVLPYPDKKAVLENGQKAAAAVGATLVYVGDHVVITNAEGVTVFDDNPIIKVTGPEVDFTSVAVSATVVLLVLAAAFVVARKKGLITK